MVAADTPPRMIDAPKARFGLAGTLILHVLDFFKAFSSYNSITTNAIFDVGHGCPLM